MMAAAQSQDGKKDATLEAYFEFEYKAERRHEFIGGKIEAMAYTSEEHATIVHNLDVMLGICLREKDCKVYPGDRMLFVRECRDVFYPDLLIVCGKHAFYQASKNMKATLNPSTVVKIQTNLPAKLTEPDITKTSPAFVKSSLFPKKKNTSVFWSAKANAGLTQNFTKKAM